MRDRLFAIAVSVVAIVSCAKSDPSGTASADNGVGKPDRAELPTMTVDEVDREVTAKTARAADCNSEATRKKMGVVPGAILITSPSSYAASELPADTTTKLVFYCADPG